MWIASSYANCVVCKAAYAPPPPPPPPHPTPTTRLQHRLKRDSIFKVTGQNGLNDSIGNKKYNLHYGEKPSFVGKIRKNIIDISQECSKG